MFQPCLNLGSKNQRDIYWNWFTYLFDTYSRKFFRLSDYPSYNHEFSWVVDCHSDIRPITKFCCQFIRLPNLNNLYCYCIWNRIHFVYLIKIKISTYASYKNILDHTLKYTAHFVSILAKLNLKRKIKYYHQWYWFSMKQVNKQAK